MFWHRIGTAPKGKKKKAIRKIEGALWGYIVSRYGVNANILCNLRRVEREAVIGDKPVGLIMIRIFAPATASEKGIAIEDYQSLDDYPELILYEGYYREVGGQATISTLRRSKGKGAGSGGNGDNCNRAC